MKIQKSSIPHYLTHKSSINDILLALGLCDKAQVDQAVIGADGNSAAARSYLQMLGDYEASQQAGNTDASALLVAKGIISTHNRDYAFKVQSFLRAEHAAHCPAAQFLHFSELLRVSWNRLLGGITLDEATPDVSHYPYAPQPKAIPVD